MIRIGLGLLHSELAPFSTYYPAILLATFVGGTAAGALCLVLGCIASWWLFLPPQYAFFPLTTHDLLNLAIYFAVGATIVWTAQALRLTRHRLTRSIAAANELTAVVTYSADAIIVFGLDSTIRRWNKGAERLFGYSPGEIIGKPLSTIVPPDRADEPKRLFPRSRAGEQMQFETVRMGKDGRRIDVSVSTGPIYSLQGEISGVSAIFRDISQQKGHEEHVNFVMRELTHRVKNLLAVIQAIARQTGRQTSSIEDFERRFTARLQSLAHSHDVLLKRDWRGATLDELIATQLEPFADVGRRVKSEGPSVLLPPRAVEQLGIALHELATNAVKHGALSAPRGSVRVTWAFEPDTAGGQNLRLAWREQDGPAVSPPNREGFGFAVIKRLMPAALGGTAALDFAPGGFNWTLVMPAAEVIDLDDL